MDFGNMLSLRVEQDEDIRSGYLKKFAACRRLKPLLEMAKTIVDSKKRIGKDKRSEKSSDPLRLLVSTNFSDAFKYMMMRPAWVAIVKRGTNAGLPGGTVGDISVR